jgi:hypothetical protein
MVQWCNGATVQWCNGAMVQWCNGATVQWHNGTKVQRLRVQGKRTLFKNGRDGYKKMKHH